MTRLKDREEKYAAKQNRTRAFHRELDAKNRREVERKKLKMFKGQRHHAKNCLVEDASKKFKIDDFWKMVDLRKFRVDNLVEKGKITGEHGQSVLAKSEFGSVAEVVEELAPQELFNADGTEKEISELPKMMRSAFEELEEKRRTVDYDRMLRKARQKIMDADGETEDPA